MGDGKEMDAPEDVKKWYRQGERLLVLHGPQAILGAVHCMSIGQIKGTAERLRAEILWKELQEIYYFNCGPDPFGGTN